MDKLPPPTPQALAIQSAWTSTTKSLMIEAFAGCGKTTLLRQLAPSIKGPALALAFNKKNATDLQGVMPSNIECSTLNSQGHRAFQKAHARKLTLNAKKDTGILQDLSESWGIGRLPDDLYLGFASVIRMAKSGGLMPLPQFKSLIPDIPESWEDLFDRAELDWNLDHFKFVRECLKRSVDMGVKEGVIDFDDQIYLSTLAFGTYEKFQTVLVDEAQDLSPLNHLQLKKSLALGGRFIVVGDPKQAIYAFRGASSKSMAMIKELLPPESFINLPLSLTFRCAKVVVARNQSHAPGFTAAEGNKEGIVLDFRFSESWSIADVKTRRFAILCRNNAPLLSCAFRLIKHGYGVTMLGRDLGKNLTVLLRKICGKKDLDLAATVAKIEKWLANERALALANGKEEKVATLEDKAGCLLAVCEGSGAQTLAEVEQKIIDLFNDQGNLIVLGTGHRAKGMEWETVVHLDPFRLPSKHAREAEELGDPAPMEQELNLRYVIETRTKDVLVLANLKNFEP